MTRDPDPPVQPDNPDADPREVARAIVLRQLTAGPRTRAQLATALARRGTSDDVIADVLDRFTDVGLIDDAAFAAAWVQSRQRGRGLARRRLAQELHTRGVDAALVREALEQIDPDEERAAARVLVDRRLPALSALERDVIVRRLVGMLARKGYNPGMAMQVVLDAVRDLPRAGHGAPDADADLNR